MKMLLSNAPLVIAAGAIYILPELTRRNALFGVPIAPDFRRSPVAIRAVRSFRIAVTLGLLLAVWLTVFIASSPSPWPMAILLLAAGSAWVFEYRRLRSFAFVGPPHAAAIELSAAPDRLPGMVWLSAIPLGLLLGAAMINSLAGRTGRAAFGPLIFGALMEGWLLILAVSLWHGVRRSPLRAATFRVLIVTQLLFGVIPAITAVAPIWEIAPSTLEIINLLAAGMVVAYSIWTALQINALPDEEADSTKQQLWLGGAIYFDRENPVLGVPRRSGFGYAINLARPVAWVLLAAPLAICLAANKWLF